MITVVVTSNSLANVHLGTFIVSGKLFINILIRDWLQWSCKIQDGVQTVVRFIQLFISHTYHFLENPILLSLETTIHHTSALKFYTCARKMEPFFLFIPVRVPFAPGICQYTVHSRSVVHIDSVWVKSRTSKTTPLIAHKSRRTPSFTQCSLQI